MCFVKAQLLFSEKRTVFLLFGGSVRIFMDCYKIDSLNVGFGEAFTFSWIAYDPEDPARKVLMDQHSGKPCHLHIGDREVELKVKFDSIDEAVLAFSLEVRKYFGDFRSL
jgi:hypothetical protein